MIVHRGGTVALLFLGLGFLVLVGLLLTGKIVQKENYVGKTALELSVGSEKLHHLLFLHRVAGAVALDETLIHHSTSGDAPCVIEGVRLWNHETCAFSEKTLHSSFLMMFDALYLQQLRSFFSSVDLDVTLPSSYAYDISGTLLRVRSMNSLRYQMFNFTYSAPVFVDLNEISLQRYFETYLGVYQILAEHSSCLLGQQASENFASCFGGSTYRWVVEKRDEHLFFMVSDLSGLPVSEIRFAIPLNSLDDLSGKEELFR